MGRAALMEGLGISILRGILRPKYGIIRTNKVKKSKLDADEQNSCDI